MRGSIDDFRVGNCGKVDSHTWRIRIGASTWLPTGWPGISLPRCRAKWKPSGQPGMASKNLSWTGIGRHQALCCRKQSNRRMVLSRNPNFHISIPARQKRALREAGGCCADQ